MRKKTLNLIHKSYVEACQNAKDIVEILDYLLSSLAKLSNIPEEDCPQFDSFVKGVYTSKMIRLDTFNLTNLLEEMAHTIAYIVIWLNHEKQLGIDTHIIGRRKALETELEKILSNAKDDPLARIHDRFGLRVITTNSEESTKLCTIAKNVIPIFTRENRTLYKEFILWVESHKDIDPLTKLRIKFVLNLPFNLLKYKDYISFPKDNNYQSLHYILGLDMFSEYLPGAEFELQFRTYQMHQNSVHGPAAQSKYAELRRTEYKNIFKIDDFSTTTISGFSSYESVDDDMDGIHFPKILVNRRISDSLVNL